MEMINPYWAIIGLSLIIILSYFFNIISKKTNIPSVLMLIALGILLRQGMKFMNITTDDSLFDILEVLGIVGLIMIVLEAALDLKLTREKWPIIWKSFSVALLSLGLTTIGAAYILHYFIIDNFFNAIIYAVPLSIMSSAIIIPSVGGLSEVKKEFMVYEGTFSDILGIMVFYFLLENASAESTQAVVSNVLSNISITLLLSITISYGLVLIFQKMTSQVKLFMLIAVLMILYSVGKLFHLSSLIEILIFGLILNNYNVFFGGVFRKWIDKSKVSEVLEDFHLVTIESAFVVRTFFFVLFGISIALSSLMDLNVAIISIALLALIYVLRFLIMRLFLRKDLYPLVFLTPRGLISILLFFGIPKEFQEPAFDSGILLYIIIISCVIMALALVISEKNVIPVEEITFLYGSDNKKENDPLSEIRKDHHGAKENDSIQ